jgi:hypothetical protein
MSEDHVVCTNELTIRFEQHSDDTVTWHIVPDDKVAITSKFSLIDLAEYGAPLSAMGIRALWKLCADGLVFNALEQANEIQVEVGKRLGSKPVEAISDGVPDGVTIN